MNSNKFVITIDSGNTSTNCCLFKEDKLITFFNIEEKNKIIENYSLNKENTTAILSSVKSHSFLSEFETIQVKAYFKQSHFLDMPVNYSKTVGLDRLVTAYYQFSKRQDSIVIDAGTFTTCDYVSKSGFDGGWILPGLSLIKNTYLQGEQLKSLTPSLERKQDLPKNSHEAINQGYYYSIYSPIKDILLKFKPSNIILTGGSAKELGEVFDQEKMSFTLSSQLIHQSLNLILKKVNAL